MVPPKWPYVYQYRIWNPESSTSLKPCVSITLQSTAYQVDYYSCQSSQVPGQDRGCKRSSHPNEASFSFVMMPSCTICAIECKKRPCVRIIVGLFLQQYEAQNCTNNSLQAEQMTSPCPLLILSSIPTFY